VTSVAFCVVHVKVDDWPAVIAGGFAVSVADTGCGGGTFGAFGGLGLQPLIIAREASVPSDRIQIRLL